MAANFIYSAIDDDLKEGKYTEGRAYTFPTGTERLFTYRSCKIHLPEFRYSQRL